MKKSLYFFVIFIPGIIIMNACSSGSEKGAKKPESTVQKESNAPAPAVSPNEMAAQMARGEQIYKEKCIACHQANGQGLAKCFPFADGI